MVLTRLVFYGFFGGFATTAVLARRHLTVDLVYS